MKRFLRMVTICVLFCISAALAAACSLDPSLPRLASDPPDRALIGVRFGDSLFDVENRFPMGQPQTSPHGAAAIRLEDVSVQGIDYDDVIYEFSEASGMQMTIAHFAPSQSANVYQALQSSLGAPSSNGAVGDGAANVEASWQKADGSKVFFSGPRHRLVLLGKDGGALQVDIALRDAQTPMASSPIVPAQRAAKSSRVAMGK